MKSILIKATLKFRVKEIGKGELAPLFLFILKGKREDLVRMKREISSPQP